MAAHPEHVPAAGCAAGLHDGVRSLTLPFHAPDRWSRQTAPLVAPARLAPEQAQQQAEPWLPPSLVDGWRPGLQASLRAAPPPRLQTAGNAAILGPLTASERQSRAECRQPQLAAAVACRCHMPIFTHASPRRLPECEPGCESPAQSALRLDVRARSRSSDYRGAEWAGRVVLCLVQRDSRRTTEHKDRMPRP